MRCFSCYKPINSQETLMWNVFPCCSECYNKLILRKQDKQKENKQNVQS
jgi:hypothetical protein